MAQLICASIWLTPADTALQHLYHTPASSLTLQTLHNLFRDHQVARPVWMNRFGTEHFRILKLQLPLKRNVRVNQFRPVFLAHTYHDIDIFRNQLHYLTTKTISGSVGRNIEWSYEQHRAVERFKCLLQQFIVNFTE